MEAFIRSENNPILKPNKSNSWEDKKVYNPGVIFYKDKYHLFYRAVGRGRDCHSSIGCAISSDGENFIRYKRPVLERESVIESKGVEDPRITKIKDTFYMAYAAYDGLTSRLCLATSKNLRGWKKLGPILKDFKFSDYGGIKSSIKHGKRKLEAEWSKSGAIFPKKINGKYLMLFGEFRIWLAASSDCSTWSVPVRRPFLGPRKGFFDENYVEMGPPPIEMEDTWLIIYHGIDNYFTYRLGIILLDKKDPRKIIYRSKEPIFSPHENYEFKGMVDILLGGNDKLNRLDKREKAEYLKFGKRKSGSPLVVFCCGAVMRKNILKIFYGAGDFCICTAEARIDEILKH